MLLEQSASACRPQQWQAWRVAVVARLQRYGCSCRGHHRRRRRRRPHGRHLLQLQLDCSYSRATPWAQKPAWCRWAPRVCVCWRAASSVAQAPGPSTRYTQPCSCPCVPSSGGMTSTWRLGLRGCMRVQKPTLCAGMLQVAAAAVLSPAPPSLPLEQAALLLNCGSAGAAAVLGASATSSGRSHGVGGAGDCSASAAADQQAVGDGTYAAALPSSRFSAQPIGKPAPMGAQEEHATAAAAGAQPSTLGRCTGDGQVGGRLLAPFPPLAPPPAAAAAAAPRRHRHVRAGLGGMPADQRCMTTEASRPPVAATMGGMLAAPPTAASTTPQPLEGHAQVGKRSDCTAIMGLVSGQNVHAPVGT